MGLSAVAARKLKAAQDAAAAALDRDEQRAAKKAKWSDREEDRQAEPASAELDEHSVNEDGVLDDQVSDSDSASRTTDESWDEDYANAAIAEVEAGMKKSRNARYFAAGAATAEGGRSQSESDLGSEEDEEGEDDQEEEDEQDAHAGPVVPPMGGHPRPFAHHAPRQAASRPFRELTTWRPSFGGESKNLIPARAADGALTLGMRHSEVSFFELDAGSIAPADLIHLLSDDHIRWHGAGSSRTRDSVLPWC